MIESDSSTILGTESHFEPHKSSWRFRKTMEANVGMVTEVKDVSGWENFYNLKLGINPVIATTHLTDTDVQIGAKIFSNLVDVGVASMQTNQTDAIIGKLVGLAGKGNFFDVANTFEDGKASFKLDSRNFLLMAQAMNERGKTMVIPSHSPHYKDYGNRILPEVPGLTAVIVANLTDRVILPVAVEFQGEGHIGMSQDMIKNVLKKAKGDTPSSSVHIAEPIMLDSGGIPDEFITQKDEILEALQLFNSETRKIMSTEDKSKALDTLKKLQKQGEIVLMAQAAELPQESRGVWQERLAATIEG